MDTANPSLKNFVELPLDKLVKADWNYKEEDQFLQSQLENNLKRNNQVENIIVRDLKNGFFEVVNGNHRFEAMKAVGFKTAIAYNLGDISQAQARRIAIATNETKFKSDQTKFVGLINELLDEYSLEDLAADMPYTMDQLSNYKDLVNFDWSNPVGSAAGRSTDADTKKLTFSLPVEVADSFLDQLNRINAALLPDDEGPEFTMAFQTVVQILAETDESKFT